MTYALLALLILSAPGDSTTEAAYRGADVAYRCDFEPESDVNYDRWPDGWKRRRGRGYPAYVMAEIANDEEGQRPTPTRCLKFELDGGAAAAYSPRIPISTLYSYILDVRLKTSKLKHSFARCSVLFLDEDEKLLQQFDSPQYRNLSEWTEVRVGPMTASSSEARWARVVLQLERGRQGDLVGHALFDDIWMGQLPRMSLHTNGRQNLFSTADPVEITCKVSGFSESRLSLKFELQDVYGNSLAGSTQPVLVDRDEENGRDNSRRSRGQKKPQRQGYSGKATWRPPIPEPGFYRVRVSLPGDAGLSIYRTTPLAVLADEKTSTSGEFGWSIPQGDEPLDTRNLISVLSRVGINWVKFPVWYSHGQKGRADELAWFAERLSSLEIQMIGVLDQPPPATRELFNESGKLPVASVFVESQIWRPAVDPVMTRLSLKVRWWQLGADDDTSFVNFPNLSEKLAGIRRDLNRFGQEINLGLAWRTLDETPTTKDPAWSFLSHVADPPLTASEIQANFPLPPPDEQHRWMMLEPLSRDKYGLNTRVHDLVLRMLAAKQQKLTGIFLPDPFRDDTGVMDSAGLPGELLIPWRTTALMVAGAEYQGQLRLPHGSQNRLFVRGDQAVLVVWNDKPVDETIYLGEQVQQLDVWGRHVKPEVVRTGDFVRQKIQVGKLPSFVVGVNPRIARWRMGFQFETERLASVLDREQRAIYRFQNAFEQGVGGTVVLHTPIVKGERTAVSSLKLSPREQQREAFGVMLGARVNSGPQPVRADFSITADRVYRFSVYRTVHIGLGDVEVGMETRLDPEGNLVVEQQVINNTDRFVNFRCLLFAQGHKRQRRQVYNLGRGRTTNVFVLPDGADLIGTSLWLRAEEIDGSRVLNHHIVVSP